LVHQRPPRPAACARARAARLGGGRAREAAVRGGPRRGPQGRCRAGSGGAPPRRARDRRRGPRLGGGDGRGRRLRSTRPEGEPGEDLTTADIADVLGGDGTRLRALQRFLGTDVPVIGVNFGRVGFLATIQPNELESGLARVFSGDYRVAELTTLDVETNGVR